MFESEKMKQICTDLHDIGMRLESKTICKIVEEAKRKLNYPSKLRVAFITDQFRGASMALKESFGLAALPEEIKPIQIVSSAKIVYTKQDVESNEPAYVLKKESEQPYSFMLGRKEDSLEYTDAQILYSRNNYEDFDWKIELAQVDYAFLVVSAIQMLNISERKLIEEELLKYFGLSRFSIILADTEMIQSVDAYNEVKARLERYLKSIGTDGTYYELGTEGLDLFVSHSLEKEKEELRALSTYMTVRLCYEDVKCELLKIKEQSLISIEELEKCLDVLKMREKTMREKGTMAACRMRDELKGRIYYNISCAHQKLYTQMCQEIYKTIDASENIKKTQKEIPGFVESTVEKFMNNLVRGFEKDLMILTDELDKQMRQDAGEYFKDIMWGLIEYLDIIQRKDSWMFVPEFEIVEPEQIEKTRKVSNAMLFFSLPFFLKGKLFRAFGAAAGSWALKKKAKEASEEAAVELLKEVVKMECHNMQIGQLADIKEEIYQLADEAEKEILHAYDCFIDAVINEMYDRMEEVKLAYSKKEILEQIFEEELPLIESKLDIR